MSHKPIVQPSRNGQHAADVAGTPDPEVVPKAERRRFTAEYKLRILAEADACTQRGQIGALLRREGLYRSHLDKWREQRRGDGAAGESPPAWGRGLKPLRASIRASRTGSPPAWGRGLKPAVEDMIGRASESPPAWGRGLKRSPPRRSSTAPTVAPCVGAWIETTCCG
jgi:transposase-like protein